MMDWMIQHQALILGALLSISEILDAIPGIKASSIWKLIKNLLLSLKKKDSNG